MLLFSSSIFRISFLFVLIEGGSRHEVKVDPSKSSAWGPGLAPADLVFPARYFFVQLRDSSGKEINVKTKGDLDVHISGTSKSEPCKVWSNILLKSNGIYIVRYKLYNSCDFLKIDLRYDNMPLEGFPKSFSNVVYSDDCNCPQYLEKWMKNMKCRENYNQISKDLEMFPRVAFSQVHKQIMEKFGSQGSISVCHYVVKSNEVYRKCYGEYTDFKIFVDATLLSLMRKVYVPDFELFVNLGDWPLEDNSKSPLPMFSWCGSNSTSDIVMPTYDLTEATLECMGRVSRDMLSVQGNTGPSWESKINKAFWRGRDSNMERLHLIKLSRKFPHLINASLTNFFFFRDKEKEYGPKEQPIPFFDFFQHKYQINLDGTVAAYRLPFLLAGDSVVLKQESPYYEHFYADLIPYVHYVPIKKDLSDLIDAIGWLKENDHVAKNISRNAQEFAMENLMPKDVYCYYAALFKEWSTRLTESPKVMPEMEHVPQNPPEFPCTCVKVTMKDEL